MKNVYYSSENMFSDDNCKDLISEIKQLESELNNSIINKEIDDIEYYSYKIYSLSKCVSDNLKMILIDSNEASLY